MNRQSLRKADLHLMVVFESMMHERKVSKVAERLHMAQPTVSAALARLRVFFDDPLFVRQGQHMEPTSRALAIFHHIGPALDHLSQALTMNDHFEPEHSDRIFHVGFSDDVELAFMPKLLQAVRSDAPNVRLVVTPIDWSTVSDQLATGAITVAVSPTKGLPARAKKKLLRRAAGFVLRSDKSPATLSLDAYCARPHIQVSALADVGNVIDEKLEELGRTRQVVMSVPKYSILPQLLLENSEFLAVLPEHAARILAKMHGLACEPLPFDAPHRELSMVWLPAHENDPAERWLRGLVQHQISADRSIPLPSLKSKMPTAFAEHLV